MIHKLKIKLKQHTPILHFQHEQRGATLRATEVKPKLDKFILEKLAKSETYKLRAIEHLTEIERKKEESIRKSNEQIESEYNSNKGYYQALAMGWLVGKGEHPALDYKMKVTPIGDPEYYVATSSSRLNVINSPNHITILTNSPFFAQVSDEESGRISYNKLKKVGVIHPNGILLEIQSTINGLNEEIADWLCVFFVVESFGTRNSKGFGVFTIDETLNGNINISHDYASILRSEFECAFRRIFNSSLSQALENITNDYRALKSGSNFGARRKSKLYLHFDEMGIGWEKKSIKYHLNKNEITPYYANHEYESDYEYEHDRHRFVRAMLGLPGFYEHYERYENEKYRLFTEIENADIKRFKSPIQIKIINNFIYFVANNIPAEILDKEFTFSTYQTDEDDNVLSEPTAQFVLTTPRSFNICRFLKSTLPQLDNPYRQII